MEECKKRTHGGNKVSKIANIFQGMPSREEEELRGADVTVVRTESHLSRFNTARALFEKLGEENRGFVRIEKSPSAAASFAGTRGAFPGATPSRSRSSSAGSVSPPRRIATPPALAAAAHAHNGDRLANGAAQPPPKPVKPSVLPKPEKPDRRFNKELIEKQRNWTAHFSKPRPPRHENEARIESKYPSGYPEAKSPEAGERNAVPSRVYSPPLSPSTGDVVPDRPTNLPSSLLIRGVPSAKSPSPSKTVTAVPIRTNNLITSATKTEQVVSPNKRDSVHSPTNFEPPATATRSLVSPQKENIEAIDKTVQRDVSRRASDHVIKSTFSKRSESVSPVPTTASSNLSGVAPSTPPRSNVGGLVSPPATSPRSSSVPRDEHKRDSFASDRSSLTSPLPEEQTASISPQPAAVPPVPQARSQSITSNKSPTSPGIKSPKSSPPLITNDEIEKPIEREQSESSESCVGDTPVVGASNLSDDYETVEYSGDWEERSKRRSSTPESPVTPAQAEDPARSPLNSPLASPVRRGPSQSPPLDASPSGMYIYCIFELLLMLRYLHITVAYVSVLSIRYLFV